MPREVTLAQPGPDATAACHQVDPNALLALASERQTEIRDVLSRSVWHLHRPRDAELRKILGRLFICLDDARRLAVDNERLTQSAAAALEDLLSRSVDGLNVDSAAELIDSVDRVLIEIGDKTFITDFVVLEAYRDRAKDEMEAPFLTWSALFERVPRPLVETDPAAGKAELEQQACDDELLETWRAQLSALRRSRSTEYRLHRARLGMKAHSLLFMIPVLLALDAGLAVLVVATEGSDIWRETLLVMFAGGLGGAVSGAYKLRDQVVRIGDVRALRPALFVQPLLGATAGLFALLILASGFLPQSNTASDGTWAKYGVVAFVAGFSEPFFLGLVGKVGGTASKAPGQAQPT
jgi:hypothetical protein